MTVAKQSENEGTRMLPDRVSKKLAARRTGVIALFPRYEVLKSPFPEFAFRPGKHLAFAKQWFVEIPVCERLS